jgi:type I restriction enzyme S subunit
VDEWREYRIGDIAEIVGGSTPSTADPSNFDGDIPWLTPKDLSGQHERYISSGERNLSQKGLARCSTHLLPAGAVLLSSRAPIGYVAIAKNPITTNQGFRSLVLKPGFEPEFVYYWLKANRDELERHASGSTFRELSGSALAQIAIQIPDRAAQRAIVHILGTLDDKIELNQQMNETLEAMARAIFKSWFVDFDLVIDNALRAGNPIPNSLAEKAARRRELLARAKTEGRNSCFPKYVAEVFPDRFASSELGDIPEGWEIKSFADTVEIIGGGTPNTSVAKYWDGDIPWFSVVDAPRESDIWILCTEKKITMAGVENSSTQILKNGTTIISARGTVGKVALVGVPMAMNQSCYGLRGKKSNLGFFTYFSTRALVSELQQRTHGSVFNTITRDTLKSVIVVSPPERAIQAFEKDVTPILELIRENLFESRTLAGLRDTLLPKLISGELRVKNAVLIAEAMS